MGGFVGRCLSLSFDDARDLLAMRREIMRSGWRVASTEAYPHLLTVNTPGGGVTDADARDLAVALRTRHGATTPTSTRRAQSASSC